MNAYRHKKRGTLYELVGYGEMQAENWGVIIEGAMREDGGPDYVSVDMRKVAVYRSLDNGALWVRPVEEFEDGRFEQVSNEPSPTLGS